jgi:Ca2+/Na+ antiporter
MYNLASTADNYLSPALETMTNKLKLSDSLAGVTLLAIGNGAPDVFSAISATGDGNSDTILEATTSVSIVLGGTFFISSVVIALTINASNLNDDPNGTPIKKIKVTPRFFLRDVFFFFLTCIFLLVIMLSIGYFELWSAITLLVIYSVYVILVVVQSKNGNKDLVEEDDVADIVASKFQ